MFKFESFADSEGYAVESLSEDEGNVTGNGVVSTIHFARHGQQNGVVFESGEFVHMRPHGMQRLQLVISGKVTAIGAVRMTVLGAGSTRCLPRIARPSALASQAAPKMLSSVR